MADKDIPSLNRVRVRVRDMHTCVRCFVPTHDGQWHHRRTRSVRDVHRHCTCVGIYLCVTDHAWVHAHPLEARRLGLIVSRHERNPWTIPFKRGDGAWVLPDCRGGSLVTEAVDLEEAIEKFRAERSER